MTDVIRIEDGVVVTRTAEADAAIYGPPPVPQVPVPPTLPDIDARQFGTGLWQDGLISYDDAKAFMGAGTLPAAVVTALDSLDDDDTGKPTPRKEATLLVVGALGYQRANPVVDKLAAAEGWDGPTTDAKWRAWALL